LELIEDAACVGLLVDEARETAALKDHRSRSVGDV
jgi:hypothetical protein